MIPYQWRIMPQFYYFVITRYEWLPKISLRTIGHDLQLPEKINLPFFLLKSWMEMENEIFHLFISIKIVSMDTIIVDRCRMHDEKFWNYYAVYNLERVENSNSIRNHFYYN